MICDNAGNELLMDMVLVDYLLSKNAVTAQLFPS